MKKIIHYDPTQAGQLHCDACGHDLPNKQAVVAALIGTPCPVCGADMLTRRDYEATARLFRAIDWINRWFGPVFGREATPKSLAGLSHISVKLHDDTATIRRAPDAPPAERRTA